MFSSESHSDSSVGRDSDSGDVMPACVLRWACGVADRSPIRGCSEPGRPGIALTVDLRYPQCAETMAR